MALTDKEKSDLCLGCLKCCKQIRIPFGGPVDMDTVKFYKARGIRFIEIREGGRRQVYVTMKMDCPNLTDLGCKIYPVRPRACQVFDGSIDPEMKSVCAWNKEI